MSLAMLGKNAAENGVFLLLACFVALLIANGGYYPLYQSIIHYPLLQNFSLEMVTNDGLMVLFFLYVGLEIKYEIFEGGLASKSQRILPIFTAIGGVIGPIIIYSLINYHNASALRGWAVPSATDIAFALSVFGIIGKKLPPTLRIFLTALAIIDDLIAVLLIAIFYSASISMIYLLLAFAVVVVLYVLCRSKHCNLVTYSVLGIILWYLITKSGVHATIAGVTLGMFIPIQNLRSPRLESPLLKLKKILNPAIIYFILPLFAFVNSGVQLHGFDYQTLTNGITLGIVLGLFLGKQVGICGTFWLLKKFKIYVAQDFTFPQFYAVSILCGIGFTMSLFIGGLAFNGGLDTADLDSMKIGVLLGSLLSTLFGAIVVGLLKPITQPNAAKPIP